MRFPPIIKKFHEKYGRKPNFDFKKRDTVKASLLSLKKNNVLLDSEFTKPIFKIFFGNNKILPII